MIDFFLGHYAYWLTILLLCIGLYGIIIQEEPCQKNDRADDTSGIGRIVLGLYRFQMGCNRTGNGSGIPHR
jgi:hypothetical protein